MKEVKRDKPNRWNRGARTEDDEVQKEIDMMKSLDHPYIVQLLDDFTSPTTVHLVLELCNGGDLFDRIIKRGYFSEVIARRMCRRLFAAVGYLHGKRIVHRDLKPENIMLPANR